MASRALQAFPGWNIFWIDFQGFLKGSLGRDTVPFGKEGQAEFVIQVPAGRKLEDRVLDVLRVVRVALDTCHLVPEQVHLDPCICGVDPLRLPDEFLIVERLMDQGICSLP